MSRRGEMIELFRFNLYNIKTIKEKRKKRDAKREIRSASARKFFGTLSPYYIIGEKRVPRQYTSKFSAYTYSLPSYLVNSKTRPLKLSIYCQFDNNMLSSR